MRKDHHFDTYVLSVYVSALYVIWRFFKFNLSFQTLVYQTNKKRNQKKKKKQLK